MSRQSKDIRPEAPQEGRSRARKYIFNGIRFGVCAAGICYIAWSLSGEDLGERLARMDPGLTVAAVLIFAPVLMICSARLVVVMATQEIHLSIWQGIKLTYAGGFLNFAMPGATGGDLYKAYCVTRWTHKKTEAVTAVFLDRVIGLGSLMMIGGIMSVVGWSLRLEIGWAAEAVGGILLVMIVGACLFFSHWVRDLIRYEKILRRLPLSHQLQRIDQAVFTLRKQKRKVAAALGLTVLLQLVAMVSLMFVAAALDMNTSSWVPYFVYFSLGMVIRSIPISIQGFGTMDVCYKLFFVGGGLGAEWQALVLALSVRLLDLAWALVPGILVLLTGGELPPKDFGEEADNANTNGDS